MPLRHWQRGMPLEPTTLHLRPATEYPVGIGATATVCGKTVSLLDTTTKTSAATCAECLRLALATSADDVETFARGLIAIAIDPFGIISDRSADAFGRGDDAAVARWNEIAEAVDRLLTTGAR